MDFIWFISEHLLFSLCGWREHGSLLLPLGLLLFFFFLFFWFYSLLFLSLRLVSGHLGQLKNPFISSLPFLFSSSSFFLWEREKKGPPTTRIRRKRSRSFRPDDFLLWCWTSHLISRGMIFPRVLKQEKRGKTHFVYVLFGRENHRWHVGSPRCNGSGSGAEAITFNLIKEQWILSLGRDKEAF